MVHSFPTRRSSDLVAGVGLFEIAGNHNRRGTASGGDFAGQCFQAIRASRHQSYAMAVRCEHARQFGAYARRGTGNQRHTFSHDSMLLIQLHVMRPTLDESIRLRRDASHLQAYRRIQTHSTTELNRDIMRFIAPRDRRPPRTLKFRHVRYRATEGSRRPDRSASACRVRYIRAV